MTRDDCIAAAAGEFAQALVEQAERTPREAAEAAHVPGGPTVDELEDRIRVRRGLPAVHGAESGAA